jgi:hypothetical protein
MENLLNQLTTMEQLSKLRAELSYKIMGYVEEYNLSGEYQINSLFEVGDGKVAYCFDVEMERFGNEENKYVYFYLRDIEGDQTDGDYMWDINLMPLEFFYSNVLLQGAYETWS